MLTALPILMALGVLNQTPEARAFDTITVPKKADPIDFVAVHKDLDMAAEAIAKGDDTSAMQALDRVLSTDPKNVDALWAKAVLANKQGKLGVAVRVLEQLLALDRYNDDARLLLVRVRTSEAGSTMRELHLRHPGMPDLTSSGGTNAQKGKPHWQPFARADAGFGFNTNLSLNRTQVLRDSQRGSAMMSLGFIGGVTNTAKLRPFTAYGYFSSLQPLQNRNSTIAFAPSSYGATMVMRRQLGPLEGALDLRFRETRTGVFASQNVDSKSLYSERMVTPTLELTLPLSKGHRPSIALATQFASPENENLLTIVTARIREVLRVGSFMTVLQVGGANRQGGSAVTLDLSPYSELNTLAHFEQNFLDDDLAVFITAVGRFRRYSEFDSGETLWTGFAGARYTMGALELHAEYGVVTNRGASGRNFNQHQIGAGLRYWYN